MVAFCLYHWCRSVQRMPLRLFFPQITSIPIILVFSNLAVYAIAQVSRQNFPFLREK